jgi:hypothetical protein
MTKECSYAKITGICQYSQKYIKDNIVSNEKKVEK